MNPPAVTSLNVKFGRLAARVGGGDGGFAERTAGAGAFLGG